MVPITVIAFKCASLHLAIESIEDQLGPFDIAGLLIVGLGVFTFNIFKHRPQKASIEEDF